jgi:PAS domain S-box-containing protein
LTTFRNYTILRSTLIRRPKSYLPGRNLFDHHAAVKLIIDPATGRIIAGNHAAEEFYGWSRRTLAKMNIQQINTKSPEEIKKSMKNAMDHKKIHLNFQHRLADGLLRDVEMFSSGVELGGRKYLHSRRYLILFFQPSVRDGGSIWRLCWGS